VEPLRYWCFIDDSNGHHVVFVKLVTREFGNGWLDLDEAITADGLEGVLLINKYTLCINSVFIGLSRLRKQCIRNL
jgi:hypothetical protein